MSYLANTPVLVLGLGESGLAMARWCARLGAAVRVWDSREVAPNAAALAAFVPSAELMLGELTDDVFAGVKLVLKSPGLAAGDARIAGPLGRYVATGAPVQGELDLFARALADLKAERGYAPKVLAITGTNGKTTTTAMTAMLVERAGKRVAMAGNIGPTMLQTLADALDLEPVGEHAAQPAGAGPHPSPLPEREGAIRDAAVPASDEDTTAPATDESAVDEADGTLPSPSGRGIEGLGGAFEAHAPSPASGIGLQADARTASEGERSESTAVDEEPTPILSDPPPPDPVFQHLPEVWVLELSSFQLDNAQGFEPTAATVLNLTQDHLDWHGSMDAYAQAKARIFGARATLVINRDDPGVEALIPVPAVPAKGRGAKTPTRPVAKATPRHIVRFGLDAPRRPGDFGLVEENGMAWLVRALEADPTVKPKRRGSAAEPEELFIQRLMPADALRVRGRHNAANALAALSLATAIGCPLAPMLHGLREYAGEPHRVQFITSFGGVDAFDDSKGTNVGATVAALNGLGADKAPGKLVVILGGDGKGQDFAPLVEPARRHARALATLGRDAALIEQALAPSGVPTQRHATLQAATRWCLAHAHAGDAVLLSPACASLDMFRNYAHRAEVFVEEVHAWVADQGGIAA